MELTRTDLSVERLCDQLPLLARLMSSGNIKTAIAYDSDTFRQASSVLSFQSLKTVASSHRP